MKFEYSAMREIKTSSSQLSNRVAVIWRFNLLHQIYEITGNGIYRVYNW